MKNELIIKRCDVLGKVYVIDVTGYIPEALESDFNNMAERLASGDCTDLEDELNDFCKFHKQKNGLEIDFKITIEDYSLDARFFHEMGELKTTKITAQVRRSIHRILRDYL